MAKGIKDVSRGPPRVDDEWEDLKKEIKDGSDRAVALLVAAISETTLLKLVLLKLKIKDKAVVEKLTGRDGPLSSLHSITVMASAMHIIDESDERILTVIRHVRNAFAHSMRPIRFSTPEIATECFKLVQHLEASEISRIDKSDPRGVFSGSGAFLQMRLISRLQTS